jgi:hypothetical protein
VTHGRPRRKWQNDIKTDVRKTYVGFTWFRTATSGKLYGQSNEPSVSITEGGIY